MTKRKRRWWTTGQRALITAHYGPLSAQPWPTRAIACHLGVTRRDVNHAARRWGLTYLTPTRPSTKQMKLLYLQGLDDEWIALSVGVRRKAVWRWRKRMGLPPHKGDWGHPVKARKGATA